MLDQRKSRVPKCIFCRRLKECKSSSYHWRTLHTNEMRWRWHKWFFFIAVHGYTDCELATLLLITTTQRLNLIASRDWNYLWDFHTEIGILIMGKCSKAGTTANPNQFHFSLAARMVVIRLSSLSQFGWLSNTKHFDWISEDLRTNNKRRH